MLVTGIEGDADHAGFVGCGSGSRAERALGRRGSRRGFGMRGLAGLGEEGALRFTAGSYFG